MFIYYQFAPKLVLEHSHVTSAFAFCFDLWKLIISVKREQYHSLPQNWFLAIDANANGEVTCEQAFTVRAHWGHGRPMRPFKLILSLLIYLDVIYANWESSNSQEKCCAQHREDNNKSKNTSLYLLNITALQMRMYHIVSFNYVNNREHYLMNILFAWLPMITFYSRHCICH